MNLHHDKKLFSQTIRATAQHLRINPIFVEKDYWITFVLQRLALSPYADITVFKGGTSLSKGLHLIDRFSEDIDLAIIPQEHQTGNSIKNLIRSIEKNLTQELTEKVEKGITSKGSRFRKSLYIYPSDNENNRIILEINSFANPYPYVSLPIQSLVFDFLEKSSNQHFIDDYGLKPFNLFILSKKQTFLEKIVALFRFSLADDAYLALSGRIRHFYDLYYLANDSECREFIETEAFGNEFLLLWEHDRQIFEEPLGWKEKKIELSPLVKNFDSIWNKLKIRYKRELSALAYRPMPDEKLVADTLKEILKRCESVFTY